MQLLHLDVFMGLLVYPFGVRLCTRHATAVWGIYIRPYIGNDVFLSFRNIRELKTFSIYEIFLLNIFMIVSAGLRFRIFEGKL